MPQASTRSVSGAFASAVVFTPAFAKTPATSARLIPGFKPRHDPACESSCSGEENVDIQQEKNGACYRLVSMKIKELMRIRTESFHP
jgi:hypothetical protein